VEDDVRSESEVALALYENAPRLSRLSSGPLRTTSSSTHDAVQDFRKEYPELHE
jgi:hypothetical protein